MREINLYLNYIQNQKIDNKIFKTYITNGSKEI